MATTKAASTSMPARVVSRRACCFEADRDVLQRRLPGKQRFGLEQIPGRAVETGERGIKDRDPARGRCKQSGGDVEQRRFAAAGWPNNGDELAIGDCERRAIHCGEGAAIGQAEGDRHVIEYDGLGGSGCARSCLQDGILLRHGGVMAQGRRQRESLVKILPAARPGPVRFLSPALLADPASRGE
jgi:hypothetical protein